MASLSHPEDRPLTIAERSCLLRAARMKMTELQDAYEAAQNHHGVTAATIDPLVQELECLSSAIKWLWRYPVKAD